MNHDNLLDKKVHIFQVKGGSKLNPRQKGNIIGLGLRGIGSSVEVKVTKPILGMIRKISHIIKISIS